MNTINKKRIAVILGSFTLAGFIVALAATTPSLGLATTYGILSSTYTNTSVTTVNGDVGFTTGPAVIPLGVQANYGSGAPYAQAGTDQGALLSALNIQPCTFTFAVGAVDLSTDITHGTAGVYTPGVYCTTGATDVSGPLTLSGSGTYIFRTVGALTTTAGAVVTLAGASACDVFWTPTQATTLGANTTFFGTVIDDAGITVGANSTWSGRLLAFGGTVTTDTNTITAPTCSVPPVSPILHVIKLVVGGTATSTDFSMYVKLGGVNVAGSPALGTTTPGTAYTLTAGTYSIAEDINASYTQSFSGACDASGNVVLLSGDNKTCTVTNTYAPAPAPVVTSGGGGSYGSPVVPVIGLTKIPSTYLIVGASGAVTYNYTVTNVSGGQTLAVTLTDDKCNAVTFLSGDVNGNNKLEPTETWKYSCVSTLLTTTTNIATATGVSDDVYHQTTVAKATATVVVGLPIVTVVPLQQLSATTTIIPSLPNAGTPPTTEDGGTNSMMLLGMMFLIGTTTFVVLKKKLI